MAMITLRPNGTNGSSPGFSVFTPSSGTRHGVLSDNNDTTYVIATSDFSTGQWVEFTLTQLTSGDMAGGGRVKQVRARGRFLSGTGGQQASGRVQWLPPSGQIATANATVTSAMTTAERASGWVTLQNPPHTTGGGFVNQSRARIAQHGGFPARIRINEIYVDVDVRQPINLTEIAVYDGDNANQCAGTIDDTPQPSFQISGQYGYSGAPGTGMGGTGWGAPGYVDVIEQIRIYSPAQVATPGFDPWQTEPNPWGAPLVDLWERFNWNENGNTSTGGMWNAGAIPNGTWHVFGRVGTLDFQHVIGEPWWGNTVTCEWVQDFTSPLPPTVTADTGDCPPKVTLSVTRDDGTGDEPDWDTDPRIQVQVSWDNGTTWADVIGGSNGALVANEGTEQVVDRFVQISHPAGACHPDAINRPAIYRARLYGLIDLGDAVIPGRTDWATTGPVIVEPCADSPCGVSWLIHPADPALNWSGSVDAWGWTRTRPWSASQPIIGGIPTIVMGNLSGRNHRLRILALSTSEAGTLSDTLNATHIWWQPPDPALPAIWVSFGADHAIEPAKTPTSDGAAHWISAPATQVGPPAAPLPTFDT